MKEKLKGGLRLIVEKLGQIRKAYPNEYVRRTPYDYADQRALLS